jgi:hypothetical protein
MPPESFGIIWFKGVFSDEMLGEGELFLDIVGRH